jgi:O-antigen/teichoic acid export membrane protein
MVQIDAGGTGVIGRLRSLSRADGLKARAARSSFWTGIEMVGQNGLKLASNLILTRLLFPEAFGIMAIVQVFLTGLQLLSDTGIRTSIIHNPRADEPDFLNTAWTIQVGRGVILWLLTCALAVPVAQLYDEPLLAQLLPVAGLTAIIRAFQPTKVFSASRHMMIGRVITLNLVAQVVGIVIIAAFAWYLRSVWALVLGGLLGSVARQLLMRYGLPGLRNTFHWDAATARELFHFGKFVLLGTAFGFVVNHADKAILGAFIPLDLLGVYTIGALFAMLALGIAQSLNARVAMPLYRMRPPSESEANRRNIFRVRRLLIGTALLGNAVLGVSGPYLIDTLYDPRYALAGPILVVMTAVFVPAIVFVGAGTMLLVRGDSRRHMILMGAVAASQTAFMLLGAWQVGIFGAILAPGLALLVTSPLRMAYARRYEAWDAWGEFGFLTVGLAVGALTCWLHFDRIAVLFGL